MAPVNQTDLLHKLHEESRVSTDDMEFRPDGESRIRGANTAPGLAF